MMIIKPDNSFLDVKRMTGDNPADDFITDQFTDTEKKTALRQWLSNLHTNDQLQVMTDYSDYPVILNAARLPCRADRNSMETGAVFFARHADTIMSLLGMLSLPYCYAAANGAMVLFRSERIMADTGNRLRETAGFVWDVMAPGAFEKSGKGFASILKVRLMHAAGRYYTSRSGSWDDQWGIPINQEDMAGTNLSFSLIIIRGLRKLGIAVSAEDQNAFIHLWNVIGSLLGLNEDLLPQTGKQAIELEQAIRQRHFRESEQGKALTKALTSYFTAYSKDQPVSSEEILQLMRYLLGDVIADMLGIRASKMPVAKLRFFRLNLSLKGFSLLDSPASAYRQAYHRFRKGS